LIPSRAAIQASLLSSSTDPERFVRDLGIARKVAIIDDQKWTLVGKALEHVREDATGEYFLLDEKGLKLLQSEVRRRAANLDCRATNKVRIQRQSG
jgi:hypothetical protein